MGRGQVACSQWLRRALLAIPVTTPGLVGTTSVESQPKPHSLSDSGDDWLLFGLSRPLFFRYQAQIGHAAITSDGRKTFCGNRGVVVVAAFDGFAAITPNFRVGARCCYYSGNPEDFLAMIHERFRRISLVRARSS